MRSRIHIFAKYADVFSLQAIALLRTGKPQAALEALERGRSRELKRSLLGREAAAGAGTPDELARRLREFNSASAQLLTAQEKLSEAKPAERKGLLARIEELRRDRAKALERLDAAQREALAALPRNPVARNWDAEAARRGLPEGTLLLEYAQSPAGWMVFGLDREGVKGIVLEIPDGRIEAIERELQEAVEEFEGPGKLAPEEQLSPRLAELSDLFVKPVRGWMEGKREVLIAPDGLLWRFPLDVAYDREKGQYLLEVPIAIGYLPSLKLYFDLGDKKESGAGKPELLAFAPAFPTPEEAKAAGEPKRLRLEIDGRLAMALKGGFNPLRISDAETGNLAKDYERKGWKARRWLSRAATREAFFANAAKARRLYLSTHGIADEEEPFGSLLAFRDENGAYSPLTMAAVTYGLDLRKVEDVTISACQVARGAERGGEGAVGLSYGFLLAGVDRVGAALWSVEEQAAMHVWGEYHRRLLAGESPREALRAAKLGLLRGGSYLDGREGERLDYARNPLIWAPFILWGR